MAVVAGPLSVHPCQGTPLLPGWALHGHDAQVAMTRRLVLRHHIELDVVTQNRAACHGHLRSGVPASWAAAYVGVHSRDGICARLGWVAICGPGMQSIASRRYLL